MSKRAEGCGQWLSANDKRSTKPTPQPSGNGRKRRHSGLLSFATRVKRNDGGLNIQVSCSPLSPRTRKKLKNAKQSKINNYFTSDVRTNDSKGNKGLRCARNVESRLGEDKQTKITVKRQRYFGYSSFCDQDEPVCRQEKDSADEADCNISGIVFLGNSFEESDELIQADLPDEPVADVSNEDLNSRTSSPPNKKHRTSQSEEFFKESSAIQRNQSFSTESEPSESFHFTQWRKEQIIRCKQIQDEFCFDESPCMDASSFKGESALKVDHRNEGAEISETPPFQFTRWAKQQMEICRNIQKHGNEGNEGTGMNREMKFQNEIPNETPNVELYNPHELELWSREGRLQGKIKDGSKSNSFLSDWETVRVKTTSNSRVEKQEETEKVKSKTWDDCEERGFRSVSSFHSEESEFQFSDWVRSQIRKCHVIQGKSE